jgi:hypothetical protein
MAKLILRYRKPGPIPDAEKEQICSMEDVALLDESPRMLLVEASEDCLNARLNKSDWTISPETKVEIPESRPRPIRRPK